MDLFKIQYEIHMGFIWGVIQDPCMDPKRESLIDPQTFAIRVLCWGNFVDPFPPAPRQHNVPTCGPQIRSPGPMFHTTNAAFRIGSVVGASGPRRGPTESPRAGVGLSTRANHGKTQILKPGELHTKFVSQLRNTYKHYRNSGTLG
jgi:hypothetical protein